MTDKPAKQASRRRRSIKSEPVREPKHGEVSERAYLIYLDEGGDALENWLRAERELTAA